MSSFATGLLAGLAVFVVLPEAWAEAGPLLLAGWVVMAFAAGPWPLWIALGLHSFLDGAMFELARPGSLASWAVLVHRIPETVAVYGLLRGTGAVLVPMVALQAATLAGYAGAAALPPGLLHQGYALAAGALLYLSWQRLHESWQTARLRWAPLASGLALMLASTLFPGR